jgi:hypothetical protein
MNDRKIFGIGLPRCGGQTLQAALQILYPDERVWHSPGNNWAVMDDTGPWRAAVEVFAPPAWLSQNYRDAIFIYNGRALDDWLHSCASVYNQSARWNHPLWKYPLSQFESYRRAYERSRFDRYPRDRIYTLDLISTPTHWNWYELCKILDRPIPDVPFPRVDRVKNPNPLPTPPTPEIWNFEA